MHNRFLNLNSILFSGLLLADLFRVIYDIEFTVESQLIQKKAVTR